MMIPVIDANGRMNTSAIQELMDNNCTMPNVKRVIYTLKTTESKAERDANGTLIMVDTGAKDKDGNPVMKPKRVITACKPVLATTVEFIDDTKVTVKNSLNDKVDVETKELGDGSVVQVATETSKELGLVYAIIKRLMGTPDNMGTVTAEGMGRILRDIVNGAHDEVLAAAENRIAKVKAKKLHAEKQANAKPKKQNPSLLETANKLAESQKYLAQIIEKYFADKAV